MTRIRIATRASELALVQARYVAGRIEAELRVATQIVPLKTTGDRLQHVSLAEIGGKGLFVKEVEEALLEDRADIAVHSAKDLPIGLARGLELVAFPERADYRDALVARDKRSTLETLREGARVGTGSARRGAQLQNRRPDLVIVPMRGNVPTRLRKLEEENLDALILACAGLARLGLEPRIAERISPEWILPAVAQGTLAIEARSGDPLTRNLAALEDPPTAASVAAERGFLRRLGGDCTVPLACLAEAGAPGWLRVRGLVAALDGSRIVRDELQVQVEDAEAGGERLAEQILAAGGEALLAELHSEAAG